MNGKYTAAERRWVGKVKEQDCSVCGASGPSAAHHIKQGNHYTTVALCWDCHQNEKLGWHGGRIAWRIAKMDEIDALNQTIKNIFENKSESS
jgi:hypothetical protein